MKNKNKNKNTFEARVANTLIRLLETLFGSGRVLLCKLLGFWLRLRRLLFFLDDQRLELLRSKGFGGAIGDNSILDEALDQPMAFPWAGNPGPHTLQTQVIITIFTSAAVIMLIRNPSATVVAVDTK